MISFKQKYSFNSRINEANRLLDKYNDKIPIIIEKKQGILLDYIISNLPNLDKNKYLIPKDLTVAQFIYVIRKRLKLSPEKSIFIYFKTQNNTLNIYPNSHILGNIYNECKDDDLFLYAFYINENTFG